MIHHVRLFGLSGLHCGMVLLTLEETIDHGQAIQKEGEDDNAQDDVGCRLMVVDFQSFE